VPKLKAEVAELHLGTTTYEKAKLAHVLRLEILIEMRDFCDAAQEVCPANCWILATYKGLLFLD
jgi:glutamine synthetase